MRYFTFEIVIEREPEGEGYFAHSPTLPGCFGNGRTIEEAKRNMREAVQQHLEVLIEHGDPIPQNEQLDGRAIAMKRRQPRLTADLALMEKRWDEPARPLREYLAARGVG